MADLHKALDLLATGYPRRATWVYGPAAMREVYTATFAATCEHASYVWLGKDTQIADVLGQTRLDDAHTAIVIRNAATLLDAPESFAQMLVRWASGRDYRGMHVLFVMDAEAWPQQGYGKSAPYVASHLRDVFRHPRTSTLLVEASVPDTKIGHEHVIDIVRGWTGATRVESRALAEICDYDLSHCYATARKALAIGTFDERALKVIGAREAHVGYVDALIACERPRAALEARNVHPSAFPQILSRLDYALDVLSRIHRSQRYAENPTALAQRLGLPRPAIERLRPHAKEYGSVNVAARTDALAWASEQVARGRRDGVLEMLAVQW